MQVLLTDERATISIGEMMAALRHRAYGVVLLLFALPNCVPLPPGFSSMAGLPLIAFGLQMVSGHAQPWLPRFIARVEVRRDQARLVLGRMAGLMQRLERVCRPRLILLTAKDGERLIGLAVFVFSLSISVPLPFTNFVPAVGVALIAVGLIVKDGLAVAAGTVVGLAGLALTTSVLLSLGYVTSLLVS